MDEALRALLFQQAERVCKELSENGSFVISDAADHVVDLLARESTQEWKQIQGHFAHQGVVNYLNKVIAQARAADPGQRKLPGLESMPLLIPSEGAAVLSEQLIYKGYKTALSRLERKITSYEYKRRKPEHLEEDRRRLAEMKAFDPRFEKYSEDKPDLTLAQAKELEASETKSKKTKGKKDKKKKR